MKTRHQGRQQVTESQNEPNTIDGGKPARRFANILELAFIEVQGIDPGQVGAKNSAENQQVSSAMNDINTNDMLTQY